MDLAQELARVVARAVENFRDDNPDLTLGDVVSGLSFVNEKLIEIVKRSAVNAVN